MHGNRTVEGTPAIRRTQEKTQTHTPLIGAPGYPVCLLAVPAPFRHCQNSLCSRNDRSKSCLLEPARLQTRVQVTNKEPYIPALGHVITQISSLPMSGALRLVYTWLSRSGVMYYMHCPCICNKRPSNVGRIPQLTSSLVVASIHLTH